jgi:hypothetical protein
MTIRLATIIVRMCIRSPIGCFDLAGRFMDEGEQGTRQPVRQPVRESISMIGARGGMAQAVAHAAHAAHALGHG